MKNNIKYYIFINVFAIFFLRSIEFFGTKVLSFFLFQNTDCSMILRDGNGTIYPIAKDCADSIREPNWLDLAPVLCIGASTIPIPSCSNSTNLKNKVAVIALVFDNLMLMPRILRCDYDGVKQVFLNLEHDQSE